MSRRPPARPQTISRMLGSGEASLLDLVDNVVNKGIVIDGDAVIGVADVDLIYLRLTALLCAADRFLGDAVRPAGQEPKWRRRGSRRSGPR